MSTADGPGTPVTRTSMPTAALTRRYPGSDTDGIPASVTTSDAVALAQPLDELGGALGLVVLVEGDDPAGGVDVEVLAEPAQPAGVLGGDDVGEAQLVGEAGRGVPRVTDRGRCQHQHAAAHGSILARRRIARGGHGPPT